MRFFNAGVEVAHDGSPVPATAAASSPPPPPRFARFSAGRLTFPASSHRDNDNDATDDAAGATFGVTGRGEVCGLPSFSVGGGGGVSGSGDRRPAPTPGEVWAEDLPPDAHVDTYGPNRCVLYGS